MKPGAGTRPGSGAAPGPPRLARGGSSLLRAAAVGVHDLLARSRGASEVAPGLAVVAVVVLLFVPLGPAAVDALLALGLGLSAAVLLAVLLAPDALRLSTFPSLLLLTTLLRLAVSVGSTRLVLARGEAGRVVEALGRVVVQGSWVAGAVVYAILALVQLVVIARGAERVAEVAARFSLDALPGKQMAIDAELRAGAIDAGEARRRRRALEQESQLHGAMDGALKFVKGDAVAGIAIALVNSLGGTIAGVLRGMPPADSAHRHVLLAAGDGLASQIPSLLLAVAAGITVTRVAGAEEGGSVANEVGRQLASEPRALWAASALLAALALAPGFPALPFASLAVLGSVAGFAGARRVRMGRPPAWTGEAARPGGLGPVEPPPPAVVEVSASSVAAEPGATDLLAEAGPALRLDLWRRLGVPLDAVVVRAAPLPHGAWRVLVEGALAASGRIPDGRALCLADPEELRLAGIPSLPRAHPVTRETAAAVPAGLAPRAAALGPVVGPAAWSLAEAAAALHRSAHELVGVQEVQVLLDALEPDAPALVRESVRLLPPALVAEVLRRLLEEGVSVRPLRTILQSLLAEGPAPGPAALAERCRRAMARHIVDRLLAGEAHRPIEALLLDPGAEVVLREALLGETAAISPADAQPLLASIGAGLGRPARVRALLAPGDLRRPLRNLVAGRFPDLLVLAYEELPPDRRVTPVGRVAISS